MDYYQWVEYVVETYENLYQYAELELLRRYLIIISYSAYGAPSWSPWHRAKEYIAEIEQVLGYSWCMNDWDKVYARKEEVQLRISELEMTKQKCIRGIIVDYDACDSSVPPSQSGLKAPSELYQIDPDMYYACTYYELHDKLNNITWNKGLPRVHSDSGDGLYGCDSLYKISEMDPIYDADMIADQIPRLLFLKQLLEKYPERRIAGYDYSALDEIGEETWKSVSEPYWDEDGGGAFARIDYEGQNLVAGVIYEGLVKVPTAPIIDAHGTQITSSTPTGYVKLHKSFLESFGCAFPLEIKVHLQTDLGVIKDTATRTILEPSEETWKSVSEPYWISDDFVRIDHEGQNLVAGKEYYGWIKEFNSSGTPITSITPEGYIDQWKTYGGESVVGKTITVELSDLNHAVIYDSVTRTIPKKPPNFEFVEDGCYIQYGDDLFCFADETKDIPPGTDIWAYFKVKNTGETAARATVKVFDGDTQLCEKTSRAAIQPGSSADFYTFCLKMTETNRDLVMRVYEYGKTEELDSLGCR